MNRNKGEKVFCHLLTSSCAQWLGWAVKNVRPRLLWKIYLFVVHSTFYIIIISIFTVIFIPSVPSKMNKLSWKNSFHLIYTIIYNSIIDPGLTSLFNEIHFSIPFIYSEAKRSQSWEYFLVQLSSFKLNQLREFLLIIVGVTAGLKCQVRGL